MTNWIVDTSVWARVAGDAVVAARIDDLAADPGSLFLSCPPQVLEYCFMARSPREYRDALDDMLLLSPARLHPMVEDVADIQRALFGAGMGRSAGPVDILTAAYARVNDAVVLTADHDYESIATVVADFQCEFISPAQT